MFSSLSTTNPQIHVFRAKQRSFSAFVDSGSVLNIFIPSVNVMEQDVR